ncbi:hypothetical protein MTO96_038765, partial [Rhipicephalus appendiculatus]
TFMADIVIAITSTGWLASEGHCKAALPNSINTDNLGHTVLKAVEKTGQEALCKDADFTGGPENYLGDPIYTYGVFSNESKVLILSEYNDSLATKRKAKLVLGSTQAVFSSSAKSAVSGKAVTLPTSTIIYSCKVSCLNHCSEATVAATLHRSDRPLRDNILQRSLIMRETSFGAGFPTASQPDSVKSTESQEPKPQSCETMLAFVMCLCVLALSCLVLFLAISTSRKVKAIICTIGEGAILEEMYPPDKYCDYLFYTNVVTSYTRVFPDNDPGSWYVFLRTVQKYKLMQLGISFSLQNVTPTDLDDAVPDLDYLRRQGIRHYGLLTVLAFSKEFGFTISSTKAVIKRLKEIQGGDRTAKTVLAIGSYDYGGYFVNTVKDYFINAANTFIADIYIAITSTGWITSKADNWFAVSPQTAFKNPSVITGLSFELSVLQYVMNSTTRSFKDAIYKPCVSVKKAQRRVLCEQTSFTAGAENYEGYPTFAYGVISNASKVLATSEFNSSLAVKFNRTVKQYGGYRARTAWLFYNVQNVGSGNQCGDSPFNVLRLFCLALKGAMEPMCQG